MLVYNNIVFRKRLCKAGALLFIFFVTFSFALQAASTGIPKFDSANAYYNKKNYKKAAALYEELAGSGEKSAAVYYNLGNAYYRMNNLGLSILNYERALKLAPQDDDIRYNLDMARKKTVDQFEDAGMAIGDAWQRFLASAGEGGWSWITVGALALALLLFGLFTWNKKPFVKRVSFFSGILLFAGCIFAFVCARQQYQYTYKSRSGILLAPSVNVFSSPLPKSENITTLHEGAKVRIREHEGDWYRIVFGNDDDGWIKKEMLAEI
ncbi:MAG: hypothetical protein FD123_2516 [Bacteroidetes bacterium]|nr:MAG: hypothetical protein FD123_2516 [Bacteroidota bacterium]